MSKAKTKEPSPLDELRRPADDAWNKVDAGENITTDQIKSIVTYERAARDKWREDEEAKLNKKAK